MATVRGTTARAGVLAVRRRPGDGLATSTAEKQPWHNGKVVTSGRAIWVTYSWPSAPDAGDRITALYPMIIGSSFADVCTAVGRSCWARHSPGRRGRSPSERHSPLRADLGEISRQAGLKA